jgi:hypothetical protein
MLLAVALPAGATRVEFIAAHDGARIPGADVCFFRASATGDYFERFLGASEIRCLPADDLVQSAPGSWNIFAVHGTGLVSAHPDLYTLLRDDPAVRDLYSRMQIRLFPAATLDFSAVVPLLGPDESIAVYFMNDGLEAFTTLRPLPAGETSMLVPSGTSVVPLLVRNGRPVAAGAALRPARGETRRVDPFSRRTAGFAVVRLDATVSEMEQLNGIDAAAPRFVLAAGSGKEISPVVASTPGAASHDSLVIFDHLAPGRYTLENRQPTWRMAPVEITVGESPVVVSEPLVLRPVTAIEVAWTIDAEVLASATRPCLHRDEDTPQVEVRLLECTGASYAPECVTLRSEAVPPSPPFSGRIAATTDSSHRWHRVSLVHGEHSVDRDLKISPSILNEHFVDFGAETITGTITMDGSPVQGGIIFGGGHGSGVSDSLGRYTAIVDRDPERDAVQVVPCDAGEKPSWYRFIPAKPLSRGMIFDVDIPQTALGVRVVSAASGEALKEAKVDVMWIDGGEAVVNTLTSLTTGGDGRAEVRRLDPDAEYEVCGFAKGHKSSCLRGVALGNDVTIALEPYTRKGRVVLPQAMMGGKLYWIGRGGEVTESAFVESDGSFFYRFTHTPDEYCVFFHFPEGALYVFRPAPVDVEAMVFPIPVATAVDIPVRLGEGSLDIGTVSVIVSVSVAGLSVPESAFTGHQTLNRRQTSLSSDVPSLLVRVALTGPVEVVFAPFPYPDGAPEDPFMAPEWAATFARQPVTPGRPVIFSPGGDRRR